jgi:hypothetical protein
MELSENNIKDFIRQKLCGRRDVRVFRNNLGMARTDDGGAVRYGLCNPGGSDLIGWKKIQVTPDMVGRTLAVFTAIEVKRPGNTASDHQKNFIEQVQLAGGLAGVAYSADEAEKIIENRKK